jgi:hypothetical protein
MNPSVLAYSGTYEDLLALPFQKDESSLTYAKNLLESKNLQLFFDRVYLDSKLLAVSYRLEWVFVSYLRDLKQ